MNFKICLLISIYLFCTAGCSLILKDNEEMKYYGIKEEQAKDTIERINQKDESDKRPIKWLSAQD
jgi:hypothetical protein